MRALNPIWAVVSAAFLGSCAFAEGPAAIADSPVSCPFSAQGLVVEAVAPESAGFRAGFMPDDRLFSWCRRSGAKSGCIARGDLRTPHDWLDFEVEDEQRGGVVVEGARGSESLRWDLLPALQGITLAPLFLGALAEIYQSSRDLEQAGDPAAAGQELERAAELVSRNNCAEVELWLRERAAQLRTRARQWPEADAGYLAAVAKARAMGTARLEAILHMSWWEAFWLRGDLAQARQQLERALYLEEKNHPASLRVAWVLRRLSATIDRQDNFEEADRLSRRAYDLVHNAAPGSGAEAASANNLASTTAARGRKGPRSSA